MATAKFNLRSKSNDKEQPIYLIFRHQKLRVVYATGLRVYPKYWSTDSQKVKNVTAVGSKDKINNLLNDLKAEVLRYAATQIEKRKTISAELLKEYLDTFTGKRPSLATSFFPFVEHYIEEAKTRILPGKGKQTNPRTIAKYKTTLKTLRTFNTTYRRNVDFETIDTSFYNDFVLWLQSQGLSLNYIGKHIQVLKTFLNDAASKGLTQTQHFKTSHFKVMKEESDRIYLSEDELAAIFQLDLSNNPRLDRVRDLFLVGAWTGLRFSDFINIKPENIQDDQIHISQHKTGAKVVIPIHPITQSILDKYNGNLPAAISNQRMNDYIKEVCKLAGIIKPTSQSMTKGGVKVAERHIKGELVTTHTARRSFATNAYKSGIPAISIMQITGHKTETAFLKYIKLTQAEHAEIMRTHWQSKRNLKVV